MFFLQLRFHLPFFSPFFAYLYCICLLYTSDAADERSSVDLGGRRIIKKKKKEKIDLYDVFTYQTTYHIDMK